VLLDEIVERVPGQRASARRLIPSADPLVRDEGRLSEVFLIEAMAQCAGLAAARSEDEAAGVLVAIDGFSASVCVGPGDLMRIEARIVKRMGAVARAEATIHVGEQLCAEGALTLRLGPPPRRSA
jgi:3-hydroxymyristoyl/3-hydroxydecanoyl-(acyl carrier protein) dehydratase